MGCDNAMNRQEVEQEALASNCRAEAEEAFEAEIAFRKGEDRLEELREIDKSMKQMLRELGDEPF